MNSNSQTKVCANCKNNFTIEEDDFNFYKKIKVPAPTWCPECRFQRRLAWRNERSLYKRKCDAPGHEEMLISMYHPDQKLKVYDQRYWHGDEWEAFDYARDYNFETSFFKQWQELLLDVPCPALLNLNDVNSDYCNFTFHSKNCYLNFASDMNEDTAYLYHSIENKKSFDLLGTRKSENCYSLIDCERCYNSENLTLCDECIECKYCYDCRNCSNCIGCVGLRSAKYCILNEKFTPEDYKKELEKLRIPEERKKLEEKFSKLLQNYPRKFANFRQSVNSTGDYLNHTKNCLNCFDIEGPVEDSRYIIYGVPNMKSVYDAYAVGISFEIGYEMINSGENVSSAFFSGSIWESYNIQYSFLMSNCKNCFGCVGLKNKQYCILNKQYLKGEYESLVPKIIEHMNKVPYKDKNGREYRYGEFFPIELSPFTYNESTVQQYFPLSKTEVLAQGYKWRETEDRNYTIDIKSENIPSDIREVENSIIGKVIECSHKSSCNEQCTKAFKITPEELQFYKTMDISLPLLCPNCRSFQRLKQRNPMKLWHRSCMCEKENHNHKGKCAVEFETSYAPERSEIIYCEKCYQAEVY